MTHCQPTSLYNPKSALKILLSTLLSMLSTTLPIALDDTLPACLVRAPRYIFKYVLQYTPNWTRWHTSSLLDYTFLGTLTREDTSNFTWLYASMYAPACSIKRCVELQISGMRRHEAGGVWPGRFGRRQVVCGVRCVVKSRQQMLARQPDID